MKDEGNQTQKLTDGESEFDAETYPNNTISCLHVKKSWCSTFSDFTAALGFGIVVSPPADWELSDRFSSLAVINF